MNKIKTLAAFLFLASQMCLADSNTINLGKLSIARVYSSSERHGAHGIQKIFDGSTGTSWISSDRDPWVRVRFTKPVTVQSVAIHANVEPSPSSPPSHFEVNVRHPGEKH